MTHTHDIIIVGGGIVGLTLACALAQQAPLSIAILEAGPDAAAWSAAQYQHRVSAIALSSRRIFQSLQVWDAIASRRISPFTRIFVRDAEGEGEIHFDSRQIAEPVLGYIIENQVMQSALREKLKQYPQIEFISPVKPVSYQEQDDHIVLRMEDDRVFTARLAVAADGASSWLRAQAGIDCDRQDYQQLAIVANVTTEHAHQLVARQIFLSSGPIAFLPLNEPALSSIVWSLPAAEAMRLQALAPEEFNHELGKAFPLLGAVRDSGPRYVFPLYRQQAARYVKSRVVLAGDAAHTVHPLAGQGVNMGLLDAASLAEVVVSAIKNRRDYASHANLRRYERWRKADNLAMYTGVDALKKLFAQDHLSVKSLLSFGLNTTDRLAWLKNIFIRHAVGDRNGLPEMAKEEFC